MFPSFLIWFRETLEIAIILSIILAATRGLPGRGRWIGLGILGGLAGSALVAAFADTIMSGMEGMGQEMFNGVILLIAVFMIGWTVIWMQSHGREIAMRMKRVGEQVRSGELPLYAIATVIALAMWREGAEIVLFMVGILSTTTEPMINIVLGSGAGFAAAALIGSGLYLGLIKIPYRYFFRVTGWMLVLLACGISAQAAQYFVAGGMLPELTPELWDSSAILSESTLPGQILHAMLGYTERPSGMQMAFYLSTLATILLLMKLAKHESRAAMVGVRAVAAAAVLAAITLVATFFTMHEAEAGYGERALEAP